MKIHASPNLTSDRIVLDVDRGGDLIVATNFGDVAPVLTRDEADELRAELDRAIGELDRKAGRPTRAAEDVLNNPEPGDRVEWANGQIWTVEKVERAIVAVHYRTTHPDGEVEEGDDRMAFRVWADPMDGGTGSPFVCVPRSDAPPPTI
jgi:hypothetical protein